MDATLENEYHSLVMKAVKGKTMPASGPKIKYPSDWDDVKGGRGDREDKVQDRSIAKDDLDALREAWKTKGRKTSGDWLEWMRRFSLELLRRSPSPVIYSCKNLAQVYQHLSHELLNASFISVWSEISPVNSSKFDMSEDALSLVSAIETAIGAQNMPVEVLTKLLSMIEFVELHDKSIPIDKIKIGELSLKVNHMAKALRCKEIEFTRFSKKENWKEEDKQDCIEVRACEEPLDSLRSGV